RRAPEHAAGRRVERPVLAGLLAGADDLDLRAVRALDLEQVRAGAEVEVGTGIGRAVVREAEAGEAAGVPVVEADDAGRPADRAGIGVERDDRVVVVVRREALGRAAARLLARLRIVRERVVVTRADVDGVRHGVERRGAAPDRGAVVAGRCHPRLPEDRARRG